MERKIVFFDIDGTLLNESKEIPASTKTAVRLLQEKGIYTAIATGRNPASFGWIREELRIESYVSINGQYVVFEGDPIHSNPMKPELLDELAHLAAENGHPMAYCSNLQVGVTHERHPLIKPNFGASSKTPVVLDPEFYKKTPVYQCNLFLKKEDERLYEERFPEFRLVRWHESAVDVLPKGISKAVGIELLLLATGIRNENCFAFGDDLNDVEMLTSAGTGIAMGNAVPEAIAAADLVTASSEEDGIMKGLILAGLLE
jgi:Cof subfamily protein (haloacid dehalogenase superfamily)